MSCMVLNETKHIIHNSSCSVIDLHPMLDLCTELIHTTTTTDFGVRVDDG